MSDIKISELPTTSSIASDDLFVVAKKVGSTFEDKQISILNALSKYELSANKGAASGYAPLNATSKIDNAYISESSVTQFDKFTEIDTIALLKTYTGTVSRVKVRGYFVVGDTFLPWYRYNATSTATANDTTVIAHQSGTGRWLLDYQGPLNVNWGGAFGDGSTDVTARLQVIHNLDENIDYPPGDFRITTPIQVPSGQVIRGYNPARETDTASTSITNLVAGGGIFWYTTTITTGEKKCPEVYNMSLRADYPIKFNDHLTALLIDGVGGNCPPLMKTVIENCAITPRASGVGIGVVLTKCFDGVVALNNIQDFDIDILLYGTDISTVRNNRITYFHTYGILNMGVNTFGSQNEILHNDILRPAVTGAVFIKDTSHHARILDNYLEQHHTGQFCKGFVDLSNYDVEPFYSPNYIGNTLTAGIDATTTTIQVTSSNYYPDNSVVMIDAEYIQLGTRAGGTYTGCTRELLGTTGATHAISTSLVGSNSKSLQFSLVCDMNRIDGHIYATEFLYKSHTAYIYMKIHEVGTSNFNLDEDRALKLVDSDGNIDNQLDLIYDGNNRLKSYDIFGSVFKNKQIKTDGQYNFNINSKNIIQFGWGLQTAYLDQYLKIEEDTIVLKSGLVSIGQLLYPASKGYFEENHLYTVKVTAKSSGTDTLSFAGGAASLVPHTLTPDYQEYVHQFYGTATAVSAGVTLQRTNTDGSNPDIIIKDITIEKMYYYDDPMSVRGSVDYDANSQFFGNITVVADDSTATYFAEYKYKVGLYGNLIPLGSLVSSAAVIDISGSVAAGVFTFTVTGTGSNKRCAVYASVT